MINIYKDTDPVEDLSPKIEKRLDKISEISHATGFGWFDITDYNNTAQFTPDDWYQALNCRARMEEAVTKIEAGKGNSDPGFEFKFYGTLADPLGVSGSTLRSHKSVRVAEYEDVCVDEWSFGCKDLLFPEVPSISNIKDKQDWDSRAHKGRNKQSVVLVADLSMPIDSIRTDLEDLIRAHRASIKGHPKEMGVSDTNIKKYTEHQVLGYWDLTLFARLKGINLTRQERAVKLFPPASHSANVDIDRDTIKYKIKPFAEKAISEGHLKRLRGQLRGG